MDISKYLKHLEEFSKKTNFKYFARIFHDHHIFEKQKFQWSQILRHTFEWRNLFIVLGLWDFWSFLPNQMIVQ
jgi:hypothetical protein